MRRLTRPLIRSDTTNGVEPKHHLAALTRNGCYRNRCSSPDLFGVPIFLVLCSSGITGAAQTCMNHVRVRNTSKVHMKVQTGARFVCYRTCALGAADIAGAILTNDIACALKIRKPGTC